MARKFPGDYLPENEVKEFVNGTIRWLRSKDVRKMLNISDSTLQSMRISGTIPSYRLGASWFYREDEIIAALNAGRIRGKEVEHV